MSHGAGGSELRLHPEDLMSTNTRDPTDTLLSTVGGAGGSITWVWSRARPDGGQEVDAENKSEEETGTSV